MLKKSLVALAIASVASVATAADITSTEYKVLSNQGAKNSESVVVENGIVVTLNAEYKADDIIKIAVSGSEFSAIGATTITLDPVSQGTMVLGLINQTATELTYRVTSLDYADPTDADNTTVGATLTIAGVELDVASILASKSATLSYSAETSTGIVLDSEKTNVTKAFDARDQFAANVEGFAGIIDVNEQRLLFTGSTTAQRTTDMTTQGAFEVTYNDGADVPVDYDYALPATFVEQDIVIAGNFAFIGEADEDGVIDDSNANYTIYADRIEANYDSLGDDKVIEVTVPGDVVIPHQTFTSKIDVAYTPATGSEATQTVYDSTAGEWKLNGALVHVPFMPFRDGFSPIVTVSNTSNQDGDIEVLVYDKNDADWAEPMSYQLTTAAKAQAMTPITSELQGLGIDGDVAFDVIVNAPAADIAVSALYYNNGDRATLETTNRSN